MDGYLISGIQQIGVGVPDLPTSFRWCRRNLGLDIPVFEDEGEAALMHAYTGGRPQARRAVLAMNLQGGGGLEIWQFTKRKSRPSEFEVQPGDLGIYCPRIKARDPRVAFAVFTAQGLEVLGPLSEDPSGRPVFFLKDPFGMIFQIVQSDGWFTRGRQPTGGVCGCLIGISDVERSIGLYQSVLGYDRVIYDRQGVFEDLACLPGGRQPLRRVLLGHSRARSGAFSALLGPSQLELIQALERHPMRIFAGRYWGDQGFMHLCFEVRGMDGLQRRCERAGFPFTVDSVEAFAMGQSSGRFSYIEDPDGTLIEFVETYRLAVAKKWGWYLDLHRRPPEKPLPRWMLRSLSLHRVKD